MFIHHKRMKIVNFFPQSESKQMISRIFHPSSPLFSPLLPSSPLIFIGPSNLYRVACLSCFINLYLTANLKITFTFSPLMSFDGWCKDTLGIVCQLYLYIVSTSFCSVGRHVKSSDTSAFHGSIVHDRSITEWRSTGLRKLIRPLIGCHWTFGSDLLRTT